MRHWSRIVLLLPLLAGGCVTHKLWTESQLDAWNEPAGNPDLRLFHDARQQDWLVVYQEISERNDDIRTRAFFLNRNQKPLAQRSRPHFVNVNSSRSLTPVPVLFSLPTNAPEFFCAATRTNNGTLAIFSCGRPAGS